MEISVSGESQDNDQGEIKNQRGPKFQQIIPPGRIHLFKIISFDPESQKAILGWIHGKGELKRSPFKMFGPPLQEGSASSGHLWKRKGDGFRN